MKNFGITLLLLLAGTLTVLAQDGSNGFTVKGTVVDSLSNEGEPYATISIATKQNPQKAVRLSVTRQDGKFSESLTGTGDYVLTVSSTGRNTVTRSFTVKAGQKTVDLGRIAVTDLSRELKGVEVVAQKPLVKSDVDKIEYNIEDDADSKTYSLLEMLRKVPMVTVDGDDNIQVSGSSSFKVYVNGKPNSMMSNNPKEVLRSMPANSVKRIEVITNPGPKYDAEGVGGILNIITVGRGMEGYTVTLGAHAGSKATGGDVFGTVQSGKLTVTGRYSYTRSYSSRSYTGSTLMSTAEQSGSAADITTTSSYRKKDKSHNGGIEASYEIDSLRLVTASLNLWGNSGRERPFTSIVASSPLDGSMLYRYSMPANNTDTWFSIDGSIDYQRLFRRKGRMLTLSYKVSTAPDKATQYTDYTGVEAVEDWQDFVNRLYDIRLNKRSNTTEQTFQIDYTTPIGSLHTIEAGAKYIMRDNKSNSDRYTKISDGASGYDFDDDYSSHYRHENDIMAAYLGYGLKVGKWSARLGTRYEHTSQKVKYLLGNGSDFSKKLDDVVPSASLGFMFSDVSNVRLSYNMRIYRPSIRHLNPYLDDSTPSDISRGNPNINTEKNHSLSLGYNYFVTKFSLSLTALYSFTNNSIESVSSLVNDQTIEGLRNPTGKDVLYTTYRNIGKNRAAYLLAYFNWNMTSKIRLYSNMQGGYRYYSDGSGLHNLGWLASCFAGLDYSLPKDWKVIVQYYGMTPWVSLQGKGNSYSDYAVSVYKSFLDKRLTITAYAGSFFKKYKRRESTTEGTDFMRTSWSRINNMRYGIKVNFRIGELKASVKKAERSINNDDVKSGENK